MAVPRLSRVGLLPALPLLTYLSLDLARSKLCSRLPLYDDLSWGLRGEGGRLGGGDGGRRGEAALLAAGEGERYWEEEAGGVLLLLLEGYRLGLAGYLE